MFNLSDVGVKRQRRGVSIAPAVNKFGISSASFVPWYVEGDYPSTLELFKRLTDGRRLLTFKIHSDILPSPLRTEQVYNSKKTQMTASSAFHKQSNRPNYFRIINTKKAWKYPFHGGTYRKEWFSKFGCCSY